MASAKMKPKSRSKPGKKTTCINGVINPGETGQATLALFHGLPCRKAQLKTSLPDDVNFQALKRPGPFIVFNSPALEFFGKPVSPCCNGFIPGNHIEQVRCNALMDLGVRIQITQQFFLCYWFHIPPYSPSSICLIFFINIGRLACKVGQYIKTHFGIFYNGLFNFGYAKLYTQPELSTLQGNAGECTFGGRPDTG